MKNKSTISKVIYFLMMAVCISNLIGCVTTKGISDSSLTSEAPYVFEYYGDMDDIITRVKRTLTLEGFTFAYDNREEGILNTNFKILLADESYDAGFLKALANVHSDVQQGRLVFVFSILDSNTVTFDLLGKLLYEGKQTQNLFQSQTFATENSVPQGHPFIMKYREMIRNIPNTKLITSVPATPEKQK